MVMGNYTGCDLVGLLRVKRNNNTVKSLLSEVEHFI